MLWFSSSNTSTRGSSVISLTCLLAFFTAFPFFPFPVPFFAGAASPSEVLHASISAPSLPVVSPSGTRPLIGVWGKVVEAAISDSSCCSTERSAARVTRGMVSSYGGIIKLRVLEHLNSVHSDEDAASSNQYLARLVVMRDSKVLANVYTATG